MTIDAQGLSIGLKQHASEWFHATLILNHNFKELMLLNKIWTHMMWLSQNNLEMLSNKVMTRNRVCLTLLMGWIYHNTKNNHKCRVHKWSPQSQDHTLRMPLIQSHPRNSYNLNHILNLIKIFSPNRQLNFRNLNKMILLTVK